MPGPTPAAPLRILGVDPGTRVTGWGVIEAAGSGSRLIAAGAVKTKTTEMPVRLETIRCALRAVLSEHAPTVVAVERPFFGKNANSALAIGMARGVAFAAAAEAGCAVHEYPPATVKKAVVGRGSASKEQVSSMVRVLLGLSEAPKPADVTDALAVALACAHRRDGMGTSGASRS